MSGSMRAIGVPMSRDSANSLTKPGVPGGLRGRIGFHSFLVMAVLSGSRGSDRLWRTTATDRD